MPDICEGGEIWIFIWMFVQLWTYLPRYTGRENVSVKPYLPQREGPPPSEWSSWHYRVEINHWRNFSSFRVTPPLRRRYQKWHFGQSQKFPFFVYTSFLDNFLKEARMGKGDRMAMRLEFFMRSTYQKFFSSEKKKSDNWSSKNAGKYFERDR